ncbi:MAG: hypothetical protein WC492_01825 [Candidatus Micrarchaeia archaeon]
MTERTYDLNEVKKALAKIYELSHDTGMQLENTKVISFWGEQPANFSMHWAMHIAAQLSKIDEIGGKKRKQMLDEIYNAVKGKEVVIEKQENSLKYCLFLKNYDIFFEVSPSGDISFEKILENRGFVFASQKFRIY